MKLKCVAKIKFLLRAIPRTFVVLKNKREASFLKEYKHMVRICLYLEKGSQEYLRRELYNKSEEEIHQIYDAEVREKVERRVWNRNYRKRMRMLRKYASLDYDYSYKKVCERKAAYEQEYGIPQDCIVQYGVMITCAHHRQGDLKVGHNILFARDTDIDFTGDLTIEDNVIFAEGAKVITHNHDAILQENEAECAPASLIIRDHAYIYSRAVIMPQVGEIGRHAIVATGAVAVNPIPPYSIVAGVPAKVLKFIAPIDEIVKFEEEHYPIGKRIPVEVLRENERIYLNKKE